MHSLSHFVTKCKGASVTVCRFFHEESAIRLRLRLKKVSKECHLTFSRKNVIMKCCRIIRQNDVLFEKGEKHVEEKVYILG